MQYSKDIVIGDRKFTTQYFMPTKGIKVLNRLTKLLGKPLAEMAGGIDNDFTQILPKAIESLLERMDESEVELVIKELCGSCTLDNAPLTGPIFENAFQGRIADMFNLCLEVVKFQFGDFLAGLIAKKGALVAMKKAE